MIFFLGKIRNLYCKFYFLQGKHDFPWRYILLFVTFCFLFFFFGRECHLLWPIFISSVTSQTIHVHLLYAFSMFLCVHVLVFTIIHSSPFILHACMQSIFNIQFRKLRDLQIIFQSNIQKPFWAQHHRWYHLPHRYTQEFFLFFFAVLLTWQTQAVICIYMVDNISRQLRFDWVSLLTLVMWFSLSARWVNICSTKHWMQSNILSHL